MKTSVAALAGGRVEDQPGSKIEAVIGRKNVAFTGTSIMYDVAMRIAGTGKDRDAGLWNSRGLIDRIIPIDIESDLLVRIGLFEVWQETSVNRPRPANGKLCRLRVAKTGRQELMHIEIVVNRQAELFEMIPALNATGGFTRLLNGGQQQSYQNSNDGDDHQQLQQRKALRGKSSRV